MSDEYDLAAVLDHYEIRFKGDRQSEQMILCPYHEDKKPSASLNLSKGLIACHACGVGGDAITLICAKEECTYQTAVEKYESITGVSSKQVRRSSARSGGTDSVRVPPGQGYKPRVNKRLPPGSRKRPDFGA